MTSPPRHWKLVVDAHEPGGEWVVMTDPEGNEFCVH